ncbi:MAG: DUF6266 family protein [Flavobacteriaceae bacterium]
MGKYNKGILGAFSGKVGSVVGASWRGQDIMRSLPRKSNREATVSQMMQREKFTEATAFLQPYQPLLRKYFGSGNGKTTRRNQALSYHMKEALTFVDPNWVWDFQKVQISRGDLLGLEQFAGTGGVAQSIDFTWQDNSSQGEALTTDQVIVAIYEATTKTGSYFTNVALRGDGTATITLPAFLSGLTVQVWVTVVSNDDKRYATSQFLGNITLT